MLLFACYYARFHSVPSLQPFTLGRKACCAPCPSNLLTATSDLHLCKTTKLVDLKSLWTAGALACERCALQIFPIALRYCPLPSASNFLFLRVLWRLSGFLIMAMPAMTRDLIKPRGAIGVPGEPRSWLGGAENRRASTRHPERAAAFAANEGSKPAKPTLHIPLPVLSALYNRINPTPTPPFFVFVANKEVSPNRRLGLPWATLGWPLGHAWATQGPRNPRPNPNPSRQRVAKSSKTQNATVFPLRILPIFAHSPRSCILSQINMTKRRQSYYSK